MKNHNAQGRFAAGNKLARKGGEARAKALNAEKRSEIAQMGWEALVVKRFEGDKAAARAYLVALGKFAYSRNAVGPNAPLTMRIRQATIFQHPGKPEDFLQSFKAKAVPDDVDFYGLLDDLRSGKTQPLSVPSQDDDEPIGKDFSERPYLY